MKDDIEKLVDDWQRGCWATTTLQGVNARSDLIRRIHALIEQKVHNPSSKLNQSYWTYNLPLQYWPKSEDTLVPQILNYNIRKSQCYVVNFDENVLGGQTYEEFFLTAAAIYENLARLFREVSKDLSETIYYPDKGMLHPE